MSAIETSEQPVDRAVALEVVHARSKATQNLIKKAQLAGILGPNIKIEVEEEEMETEQLGKFMVMRLKEPIYQTHGGVEIAIFPNPMEEELKRNRLTLGMQISAPYDPENPVRPAVLYGTYNSKLHLSYATLDEFDPDTGMAFMNRDHFVSLEPWEHFEVIPAAAIFTHNRLG